MTEVVLPRKIGNILLELTSTSDLDSALLSAMKDVIDHRIEKCEQEINAFETKYKMKFEDFKEKWNNNELLGNKYSYEIEKDYWEWEAAVSRREHLGKIADEWLY